MDDFWWDFDAVGLDEVGFALGFKALLLCCAGLFIVEKTLMIPLLVPLLLVLSTCDAVTSALT